MKNQILVVLLIIAVVFIIFAYLYQGKVDELVKNYQEQITTCSNIYNEKDCFANDHCEGIYGPTCLDCNDLDFKRCQEIPEKFLIQMVKEQKACQDSGGLWHRDRLGNSCLCQKAGTDKIWDKNKGCVNKINQ